MHILMAGASGFLGTRLVDRLHAAGHVITRLVRRPARAGDEATWTPSGGQLDPALVAAADAIVNLAGAGIGDKRWTAGYKSQLRSSRVDTTSTIARAIAHLPEVDRPAVMLQASAVGWYGDTGDRPVEEDAPAGNTFLADLCRVWEAAARPAEDAGTRVVLLRSGLPLDDDGGLLKPLMLPFRLGAGGKLGNGRNWMPWISLQDWLDAVVFLLDGGSADERGRAGIAGPVNVVAPQPVTNATFTDVFARVLHRPAILPIPAVGLRVLLGEFAGEIMRSQRVIPGVLSRAGFPYTHPDLESALRAAVAAEPTAAS
jgi:uncharacterized protein (TIGR01777 family)